MLTVRVNGKEVRNIKIETLSDGKNKLMCYTEKSGVEHNILFKENHLLDTDVVTIDVNIRENYETQLLKLKTELKAIRRNEELMCMFIQDALSIGSEEKNNVDRLSDLIKQLIIENMDLKKNK